MESITSFRSRTHVQYSLIISKYYSTTYWFDSIMQFRIWSNPWMWLVTMSINLRLQEQHSLLGTAFHKNWKTGYWGFSPHSVTGALVTLGTVFGKKSTFKFIQTLFDAVEVRFLSRETQNSTPKKKTHSHWTSLSLEQFHASHKCLPQSWT